MTAGGRGASAAEGGALITMSPDEEPAEGSRREWMPAGSELAQAEREIAAHVAVAEALAAWDGVEPGCKRLLADLSEALGCHAGVFWVPSGARRRPRVFWHATVDLREFRMMTLTSRLRPGIELPGQAWQRAQPHSLCRPAWARRGGGRQPPRECAARWRSRRSRPAACSRSSSSSRTTSIS